MRLVVPIPVESLPSPEVNFGIRALWVRVIIRALCDFVIWKGPSKDVRRIRDFLAVRKWIFDDNSSLPGICYMLDINVEMIRSKARTMTKDEVRKIEHRDRDSSTAVQGY